MQSDQRNAGACKSSLEERRRLTEGWMDGWREEEEEEGVCGFFLARRPGPLKRFSYLYDYSLGGGGTTHTAEAAEVCDGCLVRPSAGSYLQSHVGF